MPTVQTACLQSLDEYLEKAKRLYAEQAAISTSSPNGEASVQDGTETAIPPASELDGAWAEAGLLFQEGHIVHGIVTGWNRGGLLVRWQRLQGFVPASQLKVIPCASDPEARDKELAKWVGEELMLKVIELDRSRNRLVFSERATIWGPKDGLKLLDSITSGETQHGYVSNLCEFGAFVDLGGVDGLIHVSELSWGRVSHPSEMLKIGQPIEVYVISVDKENRRVALSLKRLHPDPWSVVNEKYRVGQALDAVVTNVVDFGAFARIADGLEGLIHISEFPQDRVDALTRPGDLVRPGEHVRVRIVRVDSASHRLGLSMRLTPDSAPAEETSQPSAPDWPAADANSENLLY
jgi:small subunit ribosomal protein S1